MLENYLYPFGIGFMIIFVPILIWAVFSGYLYVTLGSWNLFTESESFVKKTISLFMFLLIQIAIVSMFYIIPIGKEIVNSLDINIQQLFSGYFGFVSFIILTKKKFGLRILNSKFFNNNESNQ